MLKRENFRIANFFCTAVIVIFLCSLFCAYGQNNANENKTTTSKITENQNQKIPNTPKETTNDENQTKPNEKTARTINESDRTNVYRIGVEVAVVPDVLVSHFRGIDDANENADANNNDNITIINPRGMIVVADVVPDSPAAKAEIKRGDVIVKFGDKKIESRSDLVKQINTVKDTEQELVFIRNNKKMTTKITPKKITAEELKWQERVPLTSDFKLIPHRHFKLEDRKQLLQEMEEMFNQLRDNSSIDLFFSSPDDQDVLLPNLKLPKFQLPQINNLQNIQQGEGKALTITTHTDTNGKTKIKVTKITTINGKTEENVWEADDINQLPEDVQNEVKQFIKK